MSKSARRSDAALGDTTMSSGRPEQRTAFLRRPRHAGHGLIESVQWRGDNFAEVVAFGGMWRISTDGALEIYDDQQFMDVPVGHWIVRYQGDHTEHWLMAPERIHRIYRSGNEYPPPSPESVGDDRPARVGLRRWTASSAANGTDRPPGSVDRGE